LKLLTKLRDRGYHLAVMTNCSTDLGRRAARRCGVGFEFDAVVPAEEAGFYKPHPTAYAKGVRGARREGRGCPRAIPTKVKIYVLKGNVPQLEGKRSTRPGAKIKGTVRSIVKNSA
jgi:hypothetical protein